VEEGTGLMRGTQSEEEEEEAGMGEAEMDDNYAKKQTSSSTWHAQGSGDGNRKWTKNALDWINQNSNFAFITPQIAIFYGQFLKK
jgi:hypothetical protein